MENDEREEQKEEEDQIVNPWKVEAKEGGKIDYDKLIDKFGCQRIDESLIVASNVSPLAFLMSSFAAASFSLTVNHRDFNDILDAYERGGNFYLYTGRGPSSDGLHVDHLLPFMFTKY
ncbi:hypothetical protein NE237_016150 [Protea cynaroides]|uniref:Tryptophanyl-tRNA synthetase n=1 Tax=Protea cynaroides TaxID=273540 RepID=A0A9Q0QRW4_9MAGN|nr:hypothetical protein NE237_016150 [Protea cynaroides]